MLWSKIFMCTVTWLPNVCVSGSKLSSTLCTSQSFTGGSFKPLNNDAITPMIVSFSTICFHHTETWKYSFLMPLRSIFPGEILEYITIGHTLLSCGMICGNILFPTSDDNVASACNLLYTNCFTLIIVSIIKE